MRVPADYTDAYGYRLGSFITGQRTARAHNWKAAINVLVGYYGDRIDLDGFHLNTAE
ncbi:hypothetical protein ACFQLX_25350 [Streptomyces polyrhachis]|uniref:Uncharacterized protein n=1 Tax=Streptomyces polyrhachis TaxID=1282885 RepID=A0ABW2GL94_9ACTN